VRMCRLMVMGFRNSFGELFGLVLIERGGERELSPVRFRSCSNIHCNILAYLSPFNKGIVPKSKSPP